MKNCGKLLKVALALWVLAASLAPSALAAGAEETVIQCGIETMIEGEGAELDGNDVVITDGGRYILRGELSGSVIVKARALTVELVFDGFHAENPDGAALNIKKAESCRIVLTKGTENSLTGGTEFSESGTDASGAALKSAAELTVDGGGSLAVTGYINNGIACEEGVTLAAGLICVTAANDGVKAAQVLLSGAQLQIISRCGNGIDAENFAVFTDGGLNILCADGAEGALPETEGSVAGVKAGGKITVNGAAVSVQTPGDGLKSDSGVNLLSGSVAVKAGEDGIKTGVADAETAGDVVIAGGTLELRAALDGVDCARNVIVSHGAQVEIYTGLYWTNTRSEIEIASAAPAVEEAAEETQTKQTEEDTTLSFKISKSYYDASHVFCALYSADDGSTLWADVTFNKEGSQNNYYDLPCPAGYSAVAVYRYTAEQTPYSTEEYDACTEVMALSDYSTFTVDSVSGGRMSGEWSNGTNTSGGMGFTITMGGNPDKLSYSCKGIKAVGYFQMTDGSLYMEAYDDAIHTGEYAYITGGETTITAIDDGIHADGNLVIAGGTVDVLTAYEALEGYNIYIQGGETTIYGRDDGTNARYYVVMSGGTLDITMPYGDTDGLDANYAAWVTGGLLVVRSGAPGAVAGAVDTGWGGLTVNGGTMISMGGQAEYPGRDSEANTVYLSGRTLSAGEYTLADADGNEIARFNMQEDYAGGFITSDAFELDGDYCLLCGGETVVQWTQSGSTVTA